MTNPPPFPPALQQALDQLNAYTDAELKAREAANSISVPLYHYTDAEGIKGIIESQQIWFTHYRHLNDPSELHFGMNVARSLLNEIAGTKPSPRWLFCKCVEGILLPEKFSSISGFYIASFSRDHDDLAQWRAYGADGRGYALGLAQHLFKAEDKPKRQAHENDFVSPVVYGNREAEKLLRPPIEKAVALVEDVAHNAADVMSDKSIEKAFNREMTNIILAGALIPACLITKHQAYEHEKEVRLMIIGQERNLKPHIENRKRGAGIVPFIRHNMPIRNNGIFEIVAGPAAGDAAVASLKTFLRLHTLDADALVHPSAVPYRPVE